MLEIFENISSVRFFLDTVYMCITSLIASRIWRLFSSNSYWQYRNQCQLLCDTGKATGETSDRTIIVWWMNCVKLCMADVEARQRLCSASSSSLIVGRTWQSTVGDRAFPVAAARVYPSTSLLHLCCLTSGHASRLIFLLFPIPVRDHVQCSRSDTCHFGHFKRSFYLLTYLLTYRDHRCRPTRRSVAVQSTSSHFLLSIARCHAACKAPTILSQVVRDVASNLNDDWQCIWSAESEQRVTCRDSAAIQWCSNDNRRYWLNWCVSSADRLRQSINLSQLFSSSIFFPHQQHVSFFSIELSDLSLI